MTLHDQGFSQVGANEPAPPVINGHDVPSSEY